MKRYFNAQARQVMFREFKKMWVMSFVVGMLLFALGLVPGIDSDSLNQNVVLSLVRSSIAIGLLYIVIVCLRFFAYDIDMHMYNGRIHDFSVDRSCRYGVSLGLITALAFVVERRYAIWTLTVSIGLVVVVYFRRHLRQLEHNLLWLFFGTTTGMVTTLCLGASEGLEITGVTLGLTLLFSNAAWVLMLLVPMFFGDQETSL